MTEPFTVACIQNCASASLAESVAEATELVRAAHAKGARFLCLPEFFACLEKRAGTLTVGEASEEEHRAPPWFRDLARQLDSWILLGSIAVRTATGKVRNRSLLIDARGRIAARYDKLHLFDVDLAGGESYRESEVFEPGARAVVTATPWGSIGLSVCYDLRFPYLYRALAQAGARFLTVPAAFTRTTGEAHWHVLLRSRAIETGSYVFAPSQYGSHGEADTYGHSLIVDPWGRVLADAGEGPGFALAEVEPRKVEEARRMIPALRHDRRFEGPERAAREAV